MKKMLLAGMCLAVAVVAWVVAPVDAHLLRRGGGHGSSGDCCAPAVSDCCAPAPMMVTYQDQVVQGWKMEYKTKVVPVEVTRMVAKPVEEVITQKVAKTVMVPQKRQVTTYQQVSKQITYEYTVQVPEMKPVVQKVTTYQQVTKQVPFEYTVQVPEWKPVVQKVTTYTCVPETITTAVQCCRQVPVCSVDPCTGCLRTICTTVCEMVPRTCTVYKNVPVTRDVTVNVCTYRTEVRKGARTVCEVVPLVQDVTVQVCTYRPEVRKAVRTVCDIVPLVQNVTVQVCQVVWEDVKVPVRRIVCEQVKETVQVTQTYCERVPYNYTVKVPVYTPCAAPAPAPMPCAPCEAAAPAPCGDCYACGTVSTGGHRRHGCGCR